MAVKVRLYPKRDGDWILVAEVATRKGKRATTGKKVPRDGLLAEASRLVREVRGQSAENAS